MGGNSVLTKPHSAVGLIGLFAALFFKDPDEGGVGGVWPLTFVGVCTNFMFGKKNFFGPFGMWKLSSYYQVAPWGYHQHTIDIIIKLTCHPSSP